MEFNDLSNVEGTKVLVFVPSRPGLIDLYPLPQDWRGIPVATKCEVVTDGLSQWMIRCLSSFLKAVKGKDRNDWILIFKHDDFQIRDVDNFLVQVKGLIEAGRPLIGIAGTDSYDLNQRLPGGDFPNWHQMLPVEEGCRGLVLHNDATRSYWSLYGGAGEAKVIDGCCFAIAGSIADKAKSFVDPDFDFHFYDIAFSWNAYNSGIKPYVIISDVWHHTKNVGLPDDWADYAERFFTKYGTSNQIDHEEGLRKKSKKTVGRAKKANSSGDGSKPGATGKHGSQKNSGRSNRRPSKVDSPKHKLAW